MEVKPGYKQTEVGVIPEEWEVKRLGDVVDIDPENLGSDTRQDYRFNYIALEDVDRGFLCSYSEQLFASAPSRARRKLRSDDVLVATVRPNLQSHLHFKGESGSWVCSTGFCVVRCREGVTHPAYVFFHLFGRCVSRQIDAQLTGSNYPAINSGDVRALQIPIPTLPEQRAIAEALSDVDGLLAGLDRLIAKKRDLKQAAMQQLLTGQTRLPGFHGEWEVKTLGDIVHLIRGGIYGEEKLRGGLKASAVATTAHIELDDTWNSKEMPVRYFTSEKLKDYATVEGDLIVVKSSGSAASIQSGKIGFIDAERAGKFVFSNFLMLLRPTAVLPRFLYFYLCSHNVKKLLPTLVEASTYPNIRLGDYLEVEIPVPPPAEQTAIAEVLTEMDAELAALEQRREKTRALKQAMMQELLTGKTRLVSTGEAYA